MPNKKITKKKVSKKKSAKKNAGKKKIVKKKKTSQKKNVKAAPEEPNPIPAALLKHGINKVTDNMPEGSRLDVSAGVFMAFFGPALLKHYTIENKEKE